MADLNALIAQGAQFNLPNPVDQYSKVMQLQQMGQANQLNRLKMDEYTRGVAEQNAMRNVMSRSDFDVFKPEHQAELLRAAPSTAPGFLEKLAQVQKEKAQTGFYGAQASKMNYEVKQQQLTQGLTEISNMLNEADALASLDANVANGSISPEKAAGFKKQITAMGFPNWQKQTLTGMTDAKNRLDALAEQDYQTFRGQPVAGAPAVAAPGTVNATPAVPTISPAAGKAIKSIAKGVFVDSTVSPENIRQLEKLGDQATFIDPTSYWTQKSDGILAVGRSGAPVSAPVAGAPAAAKPDMANALALKIQGLQDERNKLVPFLKSASAKTQYEDLGKQIEKLSEGFSIPAGGARYQPGVGMIERPAAAPASSELARLMSERAALVASGAALTDNRVVAYDNAITKASAPSAGQPSELTRLIAERKQAETSGASPKILASYDAAINKQINFAPPMQVVMPVAVEDPNRPGSVIYVDRSEAIGKTPATAIEGLAPKEIQTREAKYPQAITALKGFEAKTFKLERDIEDLIANKDGLNEITGFLAGRTDLSAMSKAGRRALSTFNTITAKGGFSELQDMRNASPTGGALGNVSNTEGQQLIASFGALARTQNADDLRSSLTTIKSDLQGSKQRVKEAFDETYAYRANRGKTAAPAVNVDALLDKYK